MIDFSKLIMPTPKSAVFKQEGYMVWCPSVFKANDEYCMIYSRWPEECSFGGWCTHSEVALATSKSPYGPFEFHSVVFKGSGGNNWDANVVHNPRVFIQNGKYYMYYMGTYGDSNKEYMDYFWESRNNQRIGVAEADDPKGPWQRFDKPIIDVKEDKFYSLMVSNPAVTSMPDGRTIMIYKAVTKGEEYPKGKLCFGIATADNPIGPFVLEDKPFLIHPEIDFGVEDADMWYQDGSYYCIFKDFTGYFIKTGKCGLALYYSKNGFDWSPCDNTFVSHCEIKWDNGEIGQVKKLERPQVLIEDGKPISLNCAVMEYINNEQKTYIVHIPLNILELF